MDATRLKSIPLFQDVPDEELGQIATFAQEVTVDSGRELVREGDFSYEFMAIEDGEAMKNCIATYADRAVKGNRYLFHVDHNGEAASVEVDWFGQVLQASGPSNTRNGAADWGRQVLGQWGKRLRSAVPSTGRWEQS